MLTSVASRIERMFKSDSNVPYIVHTQYNDEVDTSSSPVIKKTYHIAALDVGIRRRKIWILQIYTIRSACGLAYSQDPTGLVLASCANTSFDSRVKSSTYSTVYFQRAIGLCLGIFGFSQEVHQKSHTRILPAAGVT